MFARMKARRRARAAGERLYAAARTQGRDPALYGPGGAPDTAEGRFEMISLHMGLILRRLATEPSPEVKEAAQAGFDAMFADFDSALREMGVGDTAIGKKVRAMAEAFYGRVKAYAAALESPDKALLVESLERNIALTDAKRFAAYVRACDKALAAQDAAQMIGEGPAFPPVRSAQAAA